MIIAVAQEGSMVCQHFGHCEQFALYNSEEGKWTTINNQGHQCGILPGYLREQGTEVIIVGGMGARPQQLFAQQGVKVVVGVQGLMSQAVELYLKGELLSSGETCSHHENSGECNSTCQDHN